MAKRKQAREITRRKYDAETATNPDYFRQVVLPERNKFMAALENFVQSIEATGGVFKNPENEYWYPVGDPTWMDLGDAYLAACEALGREPKKVGPPDNWDEGDDC